MHEPAYNPSVVPDITRSAPLTARHQQAPRPRRDPYDGLRPWSAITHGTGAVLALVGTAFLLVRAAGLEDLDQIFRLPGLWAVYDRPLHRLYSVPLRQHHSPGPAGPAEI